MATLYPSTMVDRILLRTFGISAVLSTLNPFPGRRFGTLQEREVLAHAIDNKEHIPSDFCTLTNADQGSFDLKDMTGSDETLSDPILQR